jgi:hypothetical protein
MSRPKTRQAFLETEEGQTMQRQLQLMVESTEYNTASTYSPNTAVYPDNLMPFEDKHLNYFLNYPYIDANMYVANLRVRTHIT